MGPHHGLEQIINAHHGSSNVGLAGDVALAQGANEWCNHGPAQEVGDGDAGVHAAGWAWGPPSARWGCTESERQPLISFTKRAVSASSWTVSLPPSTSRNSTSAIRSVKRSLACSSRKSAA